MKAQQQYKEALANYLEVKPEQITLFWKGRVGLYALLKAMGVGAGDEVILPGFTCVVVPNAIKYLGAKPVYVDIEEKSYNMDVLKVKEKITPKTKVIMAQNTFGLSPDMDAILSLAKEHALKVIEDCTHGFGGVYKGRKNGTLADASFYSSQWNKPFSTGVGGMVLVNDKSLMQDILQAEKECLVPSSKEVFLLKCMLYARKNWMTSILYWPLLKLFRWLSARNIVPGSSEKMEMHSTQLPQTFFKGMSALQAKAGIKALKEVDSLNDQRKRRAEQYDNLLRELAYPVEGYKEHSYLKYPLLVKDREAFMQEAMKNNLVIGDWFLSPLHPVKGDLSAWDYQAGSCPHAEKVSAHMVNLPTLIDQKGFQQWKDFLSSNQEMLLK